MWWNKKTTFNENQITHIEAWALANIKIDPERFLNAMAQPGATSSLFDDARKYVPIAKQFLLLNLKKEESNKDGEVV